MVFIDFDNPDRDPFHKTSTGNDNLIFGSDFSRTVVGQQPSEFYYKPEMLRGAGFISKDPPDLADTNGPVREETFFVSYTGSDKKWAEWIAWIVEENPKREAIIQAWDFRPGENFILNMDNAARRADKTILVLSKEYFESPYCTAEWTAAFREALTGNSKIIPIKVEKNFQIPKGMLRPYAYIDVSKVEEEQAKQLILDALNDKRKKPTIPPSFPGQTPDAPEEYLSPYFVERFIEQGNIKKSASNALYDALTEGEFTTALHAVVLSGLGGKGKTQIALKYKEEKASEYEEVFWVNADHQNILSSYSAIANALQLPADDADMTIQVIKNWLNTHENWLLVFDNADAPEVLKPYYPNPNKANGHILITSRYSPSAFNNYGKTEKIELDVMSTDEATSLLYKRSRKRNRLL